MFKNMDISAGFGAIFYQMGPLLHLMILIQEIAKEKEFKLRQGLNIVGVSHPIYWLSWLIVGTLINLMQTSVLVASGKIMAFPLFQNADLWVLFKFFFVFGQSMVFLAFFLSTLVSSLDKAI
jgi:ATP-binding cassette subfamily A (ABC1) protein 3